MSLGKDYRGLTGRVRQFNSIEPTTIPPSFGDRDGVQLIRQITGGPGNEFTDLAQRSSSGILWQAWCSLSTFHKRHRRPTVMHKTRVWIVGILLSPTEPDGGRRIWSGAPTTPGGFHATPALAHWVLLGFHRTELLSARQGPSSRCSLGVSHVRRAGMRQWGCLNVSRAMWARSPMSQAWQHAIPVPRGVTTMCLGLMDVRSAVKGCLPTSQNLLDACNARLAAMQHRKDWQLVPSARLD